jgi:hypothetical protein
MDNDESCALSAMHPVWAVMKVVFKCCIIYACTAAVTALGGQVEAGCL